MKRAAAFLLGVVAWGSVLAEPSAGLTLEQALAAADRPHPELDAELAQRDIARADASVADEGKAPTVVMEGALGSGRNPEQGGFRADNSIRLTVRKPLLDSGRSDDLIRAARQDLAAQDASLVDVRSRRRIEIMTRFFDVLLADMRYEADKEFAAVAYVRWDDMKDRLELGQISQVDLSEAEYQFQTRREHRDASLANVRATRQRLANAMNRPDDLPADLADPELAGNNRTLPEFETLLPVMMEHNPRLRAQRHRLEAVRSRMEAVRAERGPELDAVAGVADYTRPSITRDDVFAGLRFSWPLYQGRRVEAELAREQGQFRRLQAGADRLALELRQALLDTWLEIHQLQGSARPAAQKLSDYRDWVLDKARGEYEMEFRTNLGNSMAETQVARLQSRSVEYRLALAWARLGALMGEPLDQALAQADKKGVKQP